MWLNLLVDNHRHTQFTHKHCCGFGIQDPVLFDPWIRDGKKSRCGMNIPNLFFENLESVFCVKLPVIKLYDADSDPRSCQPWIPDPEWKKLDPQHRA
jgi:hypothetical protein